MARQYPTHTPLGRLMKEGGWTATEMSRATSIHPRTLSEYLSGRKPIPEHHLLELGDALDVNYEELEG